MSLARRFALAIAFVLTLLFPRGALADGIHVRIVLDTSLSMTHTKTAPSGNDPRRLAKLSSLLLYDLARPNLSKGDTFRVIPFKSDWPDSHVGGPEPTGLGSILEPDNLRSSSDAGRARGVLSDALKKLPYDAQNTYFVPGMAYAADDLTKSGCASATCVVVLLTDGLPEAPTRDVEAQKLRTDILPRLKGLGATVYVIAFGADIQDPVNQSFLSSILGAPGPNALGELLFDPTGDLLPKHIVDIFSKSFGFEADGPRDISSPQNFPLAATDDNQSAAVVLFQLDAVPPKWGLGAPAGSVHTVEPLWEASEVGASYSVQWLHRPTPKVNYRVEPRAVGKSARAMILRPASLTMDLRARAPATKLMALGGRNFPVEIVVKPQHGVGAPDGITLQYNEAGEEQRENGKWKRFLRSEQPKSPQAPPKRPLEGAVFEVDVKFDSPPSDRLSYTGHIEAEAFRGAARVVDKRGENAFSIEVYPPVRVTPTPDHIQIDPPALEKTQKGCATLRLVPDPKQPLPHSKSPKYKVRARIPALPSTTALDGALFTLDDKPLEVENPAHPPTGEWFLGAERPREDVFDPHELRFCVTAGKPGTDAVVDIPIEFSLMEAPYDDVRDVFQPVTIKAVFVGPTAVDRWAPWVFVGGAPLLLLLALYFLRYRPDVPDDLRVAVGPVNGPLTPQKLGEGSLVRRLLGLVRTRPVLSPQGGDVLGWVRPVEGDLYVFLPAQGAVGASDSAEPSGAPAYGEDGARIRVHRRYKLEKDGRSYEFRLEYAQ